MIDPLSPTWKTIEAWAKHEIERGRDRLEAGILPPDGHQSASGLSARCTVLRELLALPSKKQEIIGGGDY